MYHWTGYIPLNSSHNPQQVVHPSTDHTTPNRFMHPSTVHIQLNRSYNPHQAIHTAAGHRPLSRWFSLSRLCTTQQVTHLSTGHTSPNRVHNPQQVTQTPTGYTPLNISYNPQKVMCPSTDCAPLNRLYTNQQVMHPPIEMVWTGYVPRRRGAVPLRHVHHQELLRPRPASGYELISQTVYIN